MSSLLHFGAPCKGALTPISVSHILENLVAVADSYIVQLDRMCVSRVGVKKGENSFHVIQTYINSFNVIRIYSFTSMPSNLNYNPSNVIVVSLKLTSLAPFKANHFNAIKIYINPLNATGN